MARAGEVSAWPYNVPAAALRGADLQGRTWTLAGLRGKAVLLNFWATWCEPCRTEMPSLQHLEQTWEDERLVVLAVNFKEAPARIERFARSTALELPVLLDPKGDIAAQWGVRVFPTTVLIGADGRPRWRVRGEMDWSGAEAKRLVRSLLA